MSSRSLTSTCLRILPGVAGMLCLLLLGMPEAHAAEAPPSLDAAENDPLERLNRVTFEFNRVVLKYTARPAAQGYRQVVPRPLRDGFRNGLDNLAAPLLFGNLVLQGNAGEAARTLARFFLNTTIGVGGTIDVARRLGIRRRQTDLGQTLGSWGVGEGPYLVLPLLGPSGPRDAIGSFGQGSVDPFNLWVQRTDYALYAFLVRVVLGNVDFYSRHIDEIDSIERTSVDFYASLRSLYRDKRRAEIRGIGAADVPSANGLDYNLDFEPAEPDPAGEAATEGLPAAPLAAPSGGDAVEESGLP